MAVNKESLLRYFSGLDVATLQKLQKYSELLIIPDEDLLTYATMSQMVDKAHSLADALFPEWTDRSKADFGEFLIELFALFSEKDFWYINAFANEGIFRKMRSYSNAYAKAASLGYSAIVCKGAQSTFSVTFAPGSEITYGRGDLVISVDGYRFSNDQEFHLDESAAATTKSLVLYEGTQVTEDISYNGYCVFLRKENIDIDSISVVIDNILYTRVANFGNSSSDSTHYIVLPEEDGSCSIYFGSGGLGIQPAMGTLVTVEYRTCSGSEGNVRMGILPYLNESIESREAISVTMTTEATGGATAESLNSIREKAPAYFSHRRSAVNEQIAEDILNSFSIVQQSNVFFMDNEVFYQVIPTSGDLEPTAAERSILIKEFEPLVPLGVSVGYAPNIYVDFLTRVNSEATQIILYVVVSPGYNLSAIESDVRQIFMDFTNPHVHATYGQAFNKSDLDIYIRSNVKGVQGVSFRYLLGSSEEVIPDFTLNADQIFREITSSNLTVNVNVV